jgi:hypothetical protein
MKKYSAPGPCCLHAQHASRAVFGPGFCRETPKMRTYFLTYWHALLYGRRLTRGKNPYSLEKKYKKRVDRF